MRSIEEIAQLLSAAQVPYALIGGHAVNVLLEPRFTADIDITIAADPAALQRLDAQLITAGFRLDLEHGVGAPSGPDFVRYVDDAGTVLELQAAKTALQRSAIARAQDHAGVRVATAEDLIVFKAIANRPKDQVDLLGLVRLSGLDDAYIDMQARDWGVEAVIARARSLVAS